MIYSTIKGNNTKHGKRFKELPEYVAWMSMKCRCYNPNYKGYHRYGGRGIKVYDEWVNNFTSFYEYIGDKPTPNHSLDRINNDGDYEPDNIRWANRHEQCSNKSNNNQTVGVSFMKYEHKWRATFMVNGKYVLNRGFKDYSEAVAARKEAELKFL